jgi:hypothetical protein
LIYSITDKIFLTGILGKELKECQWQGQAMAGK